MFAELCCQSNFTFLTGASHPEELVQHAHQLGYAGIGLTDEASVSGAVRAHLAAQALEIPLVHGSLFQLQEGFTLTLLAPSRDSWADLCQLISLSRRRATKGQYHLSHRDLTGLSDSLLCLWHPDPFATNWTEALTCLQYRFKGRLWIAAHLPEHGHQALWAERIDLTAFEWNLPVIATMRPLMHSRRRLKLQHTLTAIRLGQPLRDIADDLLPSSERCLLPLSALESRYPAPWRQATLGILERCQWSLRELRYEYPNEIVPPHYDSEQSYLRALVEQGAHERWPDGIPETITTLIEKELQLIETLDYAPYFLTVHDIVAYARSQGILCQGRGSAANSVVCYCLWITEVDPSRVAVLFERFISKERNEPPDIDVDFEHHRRDEVIAYIYRKYTPERAALAAAVITYRKRSAIRDVGKALGLPLDLIEALSGSLAWWDHSDQMQARFATLGLDPQAPTLQLLLELVKELLGFPRHLTQHVGGFVISRGPLSALCPIENTAMAERTCLQWDKDDIDALGLMKIDVLALGMLSALQHGLKLAQRYAKSPDSRGPWRTPPSCLAEIPVEDPKVYDMLCAGDAIGVFQIESRAQLAMLPRLKPRTYYDLVIEVAIVRPGPIQGEMVHPYLRRRAGIEPVEAQPAAIEAVLKRTLGVPIFQEQVIQLVMVAAGFSAGEADQLRRAMATWKGGAGLGHFRERILQGMRQRGHDLGFAERLCHQIEGFGKYGFPESHAASFAILVYYSAWLKYHLPEAFYCGLLNAQPMGFYTPAQLLADAKRHGVTVLPIDVNASEWLSTLEPGQDRPNLRLGLHLIKGWREEAAHRLIQIRGTEPFRSLSEVRQRTRLSTHDLELLAGAHAFRALSDSRFDSMWQVADHEAQLPLLADQTTESSYTPRTPRLGETLVADYATTGVSLVAHPMSLLRSKTPFTGCYSAQQLTQLPRHQTIQVTVAGLVSTRQRPGSASGVVFLTLEDETGQINCIIWPDKVERYRQLILSSRLLKATGRVQDSHGVIHVIVDQLEDVSNWLGPLRVPSRDFH
ncbi:MAG: error-prone DNA polymerase [Litorivicinaceae bacterium]